MLSVVAMVGLGALEALVFSERNSATSRLQTNARVVLQRNIDAADGVLFISGTTPSTVLQSTTDTWVQCDDDAGSPLENISVLLSGTNNTLVTGTLSRRVKPLPLSSFPSDVTSTGTAPVVMQVWLKIDYDYRGRHYTLDQATFRSQDTQ